MRNQINRLCPSWLQQHPRLAQPYSRPASFPSPGKSHILKALLSLPSLCAPHFPGSWACSLPTPVGFLRWIPSSHPFLPPPPFLDHLLIHFLAGGISLVPLPVICLSQCQRQSLERLTGCSGPCLSGPLVKGWSANPVWTLSTLPDLNIDWPVEGSPGTHLLFYLQGFHYQPEAAKYAMMAPLVWPRCEDRKRKIVLAERPNGQYEVTLVPSGPAIFGCWFSSRHLGAGQDWACHWVPCLVPTRWWQYLETHPGSRWEHPFSINLFRLSLVPARADAYGLCHRRTGWLEWRDGLRLQGSRTRRQRHLGGRKEQEGHGHFKPPASQDSHRSRSPPVWQRNSLTHKYRHTHTDTLSHFIPRHHDTSLHSFLHVVNFFLVLIFF